jgi:hypothetical protein
MGMASGSSHGSGDPLQPPTRRAPVAWAARPICSAHSRRFRRDARGCCAHPRAPSASPAAGSTHGGPPSFVIGVVGQRVDRPGVIAGHGLDGAPPRLEQLARTRRHARRATRAPAPDAPCRRAELAARSRRPQRAAARRFRRSPPTGRPSWRSAARRPVSCHVGDRVHCRRGRTVRHPALSWAAHARATHEDLGGAS